MANQVVNRQVNIFIESGEAQKALDALIKKEEKLKDALSKATDPAQVQKIQTELKRLEEPIDRARKKLEGELSPSFRDVQTAVNNLGNRLKRMSEEDADFSQVVEQYSRASQQLDEQRGKVGLIRQAMNSFWKEAKTVAVGVLVGNTVESMLETVMGYVTGMVTGSAKIADELSDIEKTTGLTTEQVDKLNSQLSKIDTRSSASSLREIAIGLGQVGEAANKVNVEALDKIIVALGDEFGGGSQEITNTLTVLRNNLQDIKTGNYGEDVLHIGNALNVLGSEGLATAPVVSDIANRIAGVGGTFKLTSGQILGTAATFQELGINAERGSTAFVKILQRMAAEPEKFAKVAGKDVKSFTEMINTDMQKAFIAVATGAKEAGKSNVEFANILKDLDADGSGAGEVLSKVAANSQLLIDKTNTASAALKDNGSVLDEFSKKNNNAAGELEKLKKNFASLFASSTIREGGAASVRILNSLVNVLKGIPAFLKENSTALSLLAAGILLMNSEYIISSIVIAKNTAMKYLNLAVDKADILIKRAQAAATVAYNFIVQATTGSLTAAAAAQRVWAAAMSLGLGPLGIILTLAGALVIAISQLSDKTSKLTAEQRIQADIAQRVSEATADTVTKMTALTAVAKDNNVSLDQRQKALNELIKLNPKYLEGLTLENIKTKEGQELLDKYVESLQKKAAIEAKTSLLSEKRKALTQAELDFAKLNPGVDGAATGTTAGVLMDWLGLSDGAKLKKGLTNIQQLKEEINLLQTDVNNAAKQDITSLLGGDSASGGGPAAAIGLLESLRKKLKELQDARDKATDEKSIRSYNEQIRKTQEEINRLEGNMTKAAKKAEKDWKSLEEELRGIASSLLPEDLPSQKLEKDLQKLDDKYIKLREKAHGNSRLLLEVERLYQMERKKLVEDYGREDEKRMRGAAEEQRQRREEELKREAEALQRLTQIAQERAVRLMANNESERIARNELALMRKRGKARLDEETRQLNDQETEELSHVDKTSAKAEAIREKYRIKRGEMEKNFWAEQAQQALEYAQQIVNIFSTIGDIRTQKENAELDRDKRVNDKKKENLDKRLKEGTISQKAYDREMKKLEDDRAKREHEVAVRQFKRQQKFQIAQALISGAQAVASTIAAMPGPFDIATLGIARGIQIGLMVATTAAQVAKIASQKAPEFGRGGLLSGPSHQDRSKGLPVVHPYTGQVQAYLEGGEAIGSKRAMTDGRRYSVEGTPSQIFSLLNGINGGVQWTSGAVLRPGWSTQRPVSMNVAAISSAITTQRRFYATGGKFGEGNDVVTPQDPGLSQALIEVIRDAVATNQQLQQTLSAMQEKGVRAKVLLTDMEDQQERMDKIRGDAAFG